MRLLNTTTLRFQEFVEGRVPPYIILSHTWEGEETTYQEFLSLTVGDHASFNDRVDSGSLRYGVHEDQKTPSSVTDGSTDASQAIKRSLKRGIQKVLAFTNLVNQGSGVEWVWVDTCCIDKSSSAELSETINSMYQYYRQAEECFVYLSDFHASTVADATTTLDGTDATEIALTKCRWFYRGWTLQELLAPTKVIFFDSQWKYVKLKPALVSRITGIPGIRKVCSGIKDGLNITYQNIEDASVAEKMSWAANRSTTRTEDMAYCLLGLFKINMSLLYGEGRNAFIRLQKRIIKSNPDESIFAWGSPPPPDWESFLDESWQQVKLGGMLARDPYYFRHSKGIKPSGLSGPPYAPTNQGLEFRVANVVHVDYSKILFPLNCEQDGHQIAIWIHFTGAGWVRNISKGILRQPILDIQPNTDQYGTNNWQLTELHPRYFKDWQLMHVALDLEPYMAQNDDSSDPNIDGPETPMTVRFIPQAATAACISKSLTMSRIEECLARKSGSFRVRGWVRQELAAIVREAKFIERNHHHIDPTGSKLLFHHPFGQTDKISKLAMSLYRQWVGEVEFVANVR